MSISKKYMFCVLLLAAITIIIGVSKFILFLSKPQVVPLTQRWMFNMLDTKSSIEMVLTPLATDIFYTQLFIFQHSLMKNRYTKKLYEKMGLVFMERIIYSTLSAVCLQLLVENWKPAYAFSLWSFDVKAYSFSWLLMMSLHSLAWYVIFAGCLIMDMPDLLGFKQIYYHINGYGKPNDYKSYDLKRLYRHMRHPSIIALLVVLWTTNIMSLDRLVLSTMLTMYIFGVWRPDKQDCQYEIKQRKRKMIELKYRLI